MRTFTVEKMDANIANIDFVVQVLTVSDFLSMMGVFPPALDNTTAEFDPAERKGPDTC